MISIRVLRLVVFAVCAAVLASTPAFATDIDVEDLVLHSYLPAITEPGGQIKTLVDPDGDNPAFGGGPEPYRLGRVAPSTFDETISLDANQPLDMNATRTGAPSAFTKAAGDPNFPAGFSALQGGLPLNITNPVLSDPSFSASGNLLFWDGDGPVTFGAVPAHTTVTIRKWDGTNFTTHAVLDGSNNAEGPWLEDVASANGERSSHFHLRYDVVGNETAATNVAPDGIYLLGHILSQPQLGDSEVVAVPILKNLGDSHELVEAFASAIAHLNDNVVPVPEPAAGLLLAAGGAMVLFGRKRSKKA